MADALEQKGTALSMEQSAILKAYEQKEPLTPAAIQLILETRSLHKRKVTLKTDRDAL